jgi:hypothetical protein
MKTRLLLICSPCFCSWPFNTRLTQKYRQQPRRHADTQGLLLLSREAEAGQAMPWEA